MGLLALSLSTASAQTETLTGNLSTTKNLSASTCYELDGCYRVQSGGMLNIPAGTVIRANTNAALIVEKGGQIFATGSSSNPVVFTSSKAVSSRAPGDWIGVSIAGDAPTNISGGKSINRTCGNITGGGSTSNDNSGTLQFVRIEFAGGGAVGDDETNALNLLGVGSGTTIDHIMVSECLKDGFDFFGGTVDANYLVTYNTHKSDVVMSDGYIGKMQFLTSLRLDAAAHDGSTALNSNGLVIRNDLSNSSNTPFTNPIISNATFLGPNYCTPSGSPHSDFKSGIYLYHNATAQIYNSFIAGWRTGLTIEDANTIDNANINNSIILDNNTFYANIANYSNIPAPFNPSGTGCANTINLWMTSGSCVQNTIEALSFDDYNSSICGNFCMTSPTLTLVDNNDIGGADYGWDVNGDFVHTDYRGSLLSGTDWSSSWAKFCPQEESYCSLSLMKPAKESGLLFSPNPANGTVYAIFESDVTGAVTISVMDKVSGKALREFKQQIANPGVQRLQFNAGGLREGIYFVQVRLSNGSMINSQLSVK